MREDEYISIKDFAKRAGVSVQSIYKRLNGLNNPLNQYIKLVENQKMLNISALEEIYGIEVEQPIQPIHSTHSTPHSTSEKDKKTETKSETVSDLVSILEKELGAKNEQIAHLQKLLDQEQQLRMISEQKLLQIEENKTVEEGQKKKKWQFWK
uniref:HTH cro/C1-type domain-containing protein n=1 Tax=uncultured prokaryote TaxID=198431 RepID=A0A0H5QMG3_9ZZZZ|nr:hypothetical protein [uncultured prokaryote]